MRGYALNELILEELNQNNVILYLDPKSHFLKVQ